MKFLCLHGSGTHSEVMMAQTAALRYELGDSHVYDYVDGTVEDDMAPEIQGLFPASDTYYSYFSDDAGSCIRALEDLANYIKIEGPFDGLLCFSTGASLGATLLIQYADNKTKSSQLQVPFKVAIFLSGLEPADPSWLVDKGELRIIKSSNEPLIKIPTAHVWGSNDRKWSTSSQNLSLLCEKDVSHSFVHDGEHEIPGAKDKSGLTGAVGAIRSTIEMSLMAS